MATWEDVARAAEAMPEVVAETVQGARRWSTHGRLVTWERPLRRADLEHLGDAAPDGPVLAVRVADEEEKAALIQERPEVAFTTPHFVGYPVVLLRLDALPVDLLAELVTDAWLDRAQVRVRKAWLQEHPAPEA
ncbi:MmcQ/YjbR family DNA-binding protein [Cellulomonas endophytica]|uniref:MmcQ/YjbR family DNA-binding protein n=1 Tax=Cellulomonas endophytica TaxID=2494735 RepID=UPI001010134F|nr:MmcQ/YjbR family DNA-binding protein [Cellulomonas endophytica]